MMAQTKGARHQRIREILGRESIRSQTDLAERLLADGVDVTQATLSRDLVELGAVKVRQGRTLVYAVPGGVRRMTRFADDSAVTSNSPDSRRNRWTASVRAAPARGVRSPPSPGTA